MIKKLPHQDTIKEHFSYRADGNLIWKKKLNPRAPIGSVAGYSDKLGYRHIRLKGKRYSLHRLIWVYFNGFLDESLEIDHIDRNPRNNKIENLRPVTHQKNHCNRGCDKDSKSGYAGVYWFKPTKRWLVQVTRKGKTYNLGYHRDIQQAIKCRADFIQKIDVQ